MSIRRNRRLPDYVMDELLLLLKSSAKQYSFNDIFEIIYEKLKERNAVSGGEEMLRLRCYEKLQGLVEQGLATRKNKMYKGNKKSIEKALKEEALALNKSK